jgi:hypothetical protein
MLIPKGCMVSTCEQVVCGYLYGTSKVPMNLILTYEIVGCSGMNYISWADLRKNNASQNLAKIWISAIIL